jgi:hypothetical protein
MTPLKFRSDREMLAANPCRYRMNLWKSWYCPNPPTETIGGKGYCTDHAEEVRAFQRLERADWND